MSTDADAAAPPLNLSEVTIGILTALEEEYAACKGIFDPDKEGREEHRQATSGSFTCWLCSIQAKHGGHHVVAILLLTEMGNNAAAIGSNLLLHHCANVDSLIMCGIAGAVPNSDDSEHHVRLGDIVVNDRTGIIQYDRGKQKDPRRFAEPSSQLVTLGVWQRLTHMFLSLFQRCRYQENVPHHATSHVVMGDADPLSGFDYRAPPRPPSAELLAAVQRIHADEALLNTTIPRRWEVLVNHFIETVADNPQAWKRPKNSQDKLIDSPDGTGSPIRHPRDNSRRSGCPRVFRGPIGSANVVQADPLRRNALRDRHGIKAVEMEGSGVADAGWMANVGYLVIRGTCDYCNSTKNNAWHHYAALIAAAYTRTVIEYLHPMVQPSIGAAGAGIAAPPPSRVVFPQSTDSSQKGLSQMVSVVDAVDTDAKHSFGAEPTLLAENGLPLSAVKPVTVPTESDAIPERALPSSDFARQMVAELQSRPPVEAETGVIGDFIAKIDTLRKEFRFSETVPSAAKLEKQLRLLPRRGSQVRDGWIALARIEIQRLNIDKQAGRSIDVSRLGMLRQEAENVTD
ncbi:MAG: hypothetical protein L6306_05485 [Planctomycetales bacterium]|nr:hypothetical protein [Planctomycetales bacterium]